MKPRRVINFNYELSISTGSSKGIMKSYNEYSSTATASDTINQQKINATNIQNGNQLRILELLSSIVFS